MIKVNFKAYGTYLTESLHQWDLNQTLEVTGLNLDSAPEVHFSNSNSDRAIVRQASLKSQIITVSIPNSLLQEPHRIFAHIGVYEGDTFKVVEVAEIPVKPRKRPADYQLTDADEEVYSFKRLENLLANRATLADADALSNRINNIVANANATDGNSELVDIRAGADGENYTSAGEAVRTQFKQVAPEGINIIYTSNGANNLINKAKMQAGYYVGTNGVKTAGAGWNLSTKIDVTDLAHVWLNGGVGLSCFYKADGSFLSYINGISGKINVPASAAYMLASVADEYKATAFISVTERTPYDSGLVELHSKPYEPGFIPFTVPVNQTKPSADTSQTLTETEDYVNVDCHLALPEHYSPFGEPVKLLMLCHGAGQGVDSWREHPGYADIVQKFNDRGYAVFDCNGFRNDELGWSFWGDRRGVEAWRKAYKYVVDNYNVEKNFSIYAFSMGGLTALQLAFHSFPGINCIAMGSPVINLAACWEDISVRPVLKTLYGLTDEWDDATVAGCDPYKRLIEVNGVKYCPANLPPIKIWYGSKETSYGVNKQYAQDLVDAIKATGGLAEYREVNGAGHEISYGSNELCNREYLIYVERFNNLKSI